MNGTAENSPREAESTTSASSHQYSHLSSTDTDSVPPTSPPSASLTVTDSPRDNSLNQSLQQNSTPQKPSPQKSSPQISRPKSESSSSSIPRPPNRNSQQAEQMELSVKQPAPAAPVSPPDVKNKAPNPPDVKTDKTKSPAPTKPDSAPKHNVPSNTSKHNAPPAPTSSSAPPRQSESSTPAPAPEREPYVQRPQVSPQSAQQGLDPYLNPPSGTLADLKKKRAKELQDSLRFHDAKRVSQQIEKHNENYETNGQYNNTGNNTGSGSSVNGQNGAVRRDSDASYYGLDDNAPKHKFTASTQEIVGGQDNQTGCCVLM